MDAELAKARSELIAEIEAAFGGVRWIGGVTLHEARALDNWEPPGYAQMHRDKDPEARWQDVSDEKVREFSDVFPFLDPAGFRFYLPAYMVVALRSGEDCGDALWFISSLYPSRRTAPPPYPPDERFALLDDRQSRAVCRFLRFMSRLRPEDSIQFDGALDAHWGWFCPADPEPELPQGITRWSTRPQRQPRERSRDQESP